MKINKKNVEIRWLGAIFVFLLYGSVFAISPRKIKLNEAINLALSQNPEVLGKNEALGKAEAGKTLARVSFLPQLKAEAGYTYIDPVPEIEMSLPSPSPAIPSTSKKIQMGYHNNEKISFGILQNVFSWGADLDQFRAAELGINIASLGLSDVRQNITLQVAKTFYSILLLNEQIDLLQKIVSQKQKHLKDVMVQYKVGVAAELDKLRTEESLENIKPEINAAKNKLDIAELQLKNLIGIKAEEEIIWEGRINYKNNLDALAEIMSNAEKNNSQVQMLGKKVEMLAYQASSAKSRNKPSFNLGGKLDYSNPSNNKDEWGSGYSLFAQLSWPIFDGLSASAQARQILADKYETEYALKSAKEGVGLAVRTAFLTAKNAALRRETFLRNLGLAEKVYEVAKAGFRNGTATNSDVLDADIGLMQAKMNRLISDYEYIVANLELRRAAGVIEKDLENL